MANVPVRFPRVAAAFDKEAARVRLCGGEQSPEADLSDLVNSFMEVDGEEAEEVERKMDGGDGAESENNDRLRSLLFGEDDDGAKHRISAQADDGALQLIGSRGQGFKRQLMSNLRQGGLDAGVCESRWEKNGNVQGGRYEYVDVKVNGTRYIVEAYLSEEFSIARPTASYESLLGVFPEIFVGTVEELKQIASYMCTAAKDSMKSMDMPMAPWRRHSYVQAKWTSYYKRITDAAPAPPEDSYRRSERPVGMPMPAHCGDGFGGRVGGFRVGHFI